VCDKLGNSSKLIGCKLESRVSVLKHALKVTNMDCYSLLG